MDVTTDEKKIAEENIAEEKTKENKTVTWAKSNAPFIALAIIAFAVMLVLFSPDKGSVPIKMTMTSQDNAMANLDTSTPQKIVMFSEDLSKEDLYEMVICPCCNSPISKRCCGAATERINYIDGLVDSGTSTDDVLMLVAKKYGIESIIDDGIRQKLKNNLIASAPEDRPIISISPIYFDFGNVSVVVTL